MNLAAVIYNPKSGSALSKRKLVKLFNTAGITVERYVSIGDDLEKVLRPLCTANSVIAAIGGDGTIASVALILRDTKAIFAPLPGGTLNHFAKDAGISDNLEAAITNLLAAKTRTVDTASVNNTLFLNNSSIGIYPTSLQTRKRFEDTLGKWPAAVISSIRAFVRFRIHTVTIDSKIYRTPFIFVGNNIYDIDNGGLRTTLNSGKLCVYVIKSDKRRTVLRILISSLVGKARSDNDLICLSTRTFTIQSKRSKLSISSDGELRRLDTPIVYELLPGSLKILV